MSFQAKFQLSEKQIWESLPYILRLLIQTDLDISAITTNQ